MNETFLCDFESGNKVIVLNVTTGVFTEYLFDDWRTLNWCPSGVRLGVEAAHIMRYSDWSASQRWTTLDQMREFHALATSKGIDLRGMPEQSTWRHRLTAGFGQKTDKTGENDLRAWVEALRVRPRLWDTFQRPENLGEHLDPTEDLRQRENDQHTRKTAGFAYREWLKDASRRLSANGGDYEHSVAGQRAYESDCVSSVIDRLRTHTSEPNALARVTHGVATYTRTDGTAITVPLLDILGILPRKRGGWKKPAKATQYVSCMMLLVNQDGERYLNPRTAQPYSFRDIKQYGMVSSGFHLKPGFLRPKFYHHGIKELAKQFIPTKQVSDANKKIRTVVNLDPTNPDDAALHRWMTRVCMIAYEQTTKAMRDYLNTRQEPSVLFD